MPIKNIGIHMQRPVTWKSKSNSDLGVVDLSLNINEGKKLSIKKIDFKGNFLVESKVLKNYFTKRKKLFKFYY